MIIGISGKIGSGKDTVGKIIQYLILDNHTKNYLKKDWITNKDDEYLLIKYSNWKIVKFAGKLKEIVSILTGCKIQDLESQEFKNKQLSSEWDYYRQGINLNPSVVTEEVAKMLGDSRIYHYTYRDLLQKIGTEAMRNNIHNNIWVNALFSEYKTTLQTVEQTERILKYCKDNNLKNISYDEQNKLIPENLPNWIITDVRFPNELKAIEDRNGIIIRIDRKRIETINYNNIKVNWIPIPGIDYKEHLSETVLDNAKFSYEIDNNGTIEELIEKVKEILTLEKII